jgi:DeoR/GlpR family transcriptional regulator of sugar metabolism
MTKWEEEAPREHGASPKLTPLRGTRLGGDERRSRIVEMVDAGRRVRINDLAHQFGVSSVTIHRDLDHLAKSGLVERVLGGAAALGSGHRTVITDWNQRLQDAAEQKAAIARHAVAQVQDGDTIFIDASTTALALAYEIERANLSSLTLVTNSPAVGHQIKATNVHIIVCPGEVDQTLGMIGGSWTTKFLEELYFSTAFVSAGGITARSVTTSRPAVRDVLKTVVSRSERAFCLMQASKIGRIGMIEVMWPGEFAAIIVDDGIENRDRKDLEQAGVTIETAGLPSMSADEESASSPGSRPPFHPTSQMS